jgi:hypothetical protein
LRKYILVGVCALLFAAPTSALAPSKEPIYTFTPVIRDFKVQTSPESRPTPKTATDPIVITLTPAPKVVHTSPPRVGNSVSGIATYYCLTGVSACHYAYSGGLYAAAGPALRVGNWRGRKVQVCYNSCVTVTLIDWCQCYKGTKNERIIDLYSDAFKRLAPLSLGEIRVKVSWTN